MVDATIPNDAKKRRGRNSLNPEQIVSAANTILRSYGIKKLSMREIARVLNCSVASPYAYFKTREEIIIILIQRGEETLIQDLRNAVASADHTIDKLKALAYSYWNFSQNNKELHKLMFQGSGSIHRKALPPVPVSYRILLETIRKGCFKKEIRIEWAEYPALGRTIWAWIYGILVLDMTDVLKKRKDESKPLEEGIYFFSKILRLETNNH